MQLRQRSTAQREAMLEAPVPDSDLSDAEEGAPSPQAAMDIFTDDEEGGDEDQEGVDAEDSDESDFDPENPEPLVRRKGDTRRRDVRTRRVRKPGRWLKPALIEQVLVTIGRADLFDVDSFKALRATCKAFCELIDSTGAISAVKFTVKSSGRCDALEAWSGGGRLLRRTTAVSITGKMPVALAGRVLVALSTHRPPLAKLELENVGDVGEVLLAAPLSALRELSIINTNRSSKIMKEVVAYPDLAGLTALTIESGPKVDAGTLITVLTHFSDLKSLSLTYIPVKGNHAQPDALQNSLSRLESLRLARCVDAVDKIHLLGAQGPTLPALRSLYLESVPFPSLEGDACPWLRQLTALRLNNARVRSVAFTRALSGGSLEELHLEVGYMPVADDNWSWSDLNLPHSSKLIFSRAGAGDIMGDIARATLPALCSATLFFAKQTSVSSVQAFAAAFPTLRELELVPGAEAPEGHVVEALGRDVLPLLETFKWDAKTDNAEIIAHNLFPVGPAAAGHARCPRLRSLRVGLVKMTWNAADSNQKEFLETLARAGSHFPGLKSLYAVASDGYGNGASPEAAVAFLEAAAEGQVWPLLERLNIRARVDPAHPVRLKAKEMWPKAAFE